MKYEHEPYRDDRDSTQRLRARQNGEKLTWKEYIPPFLLIALIVLIIFLLAS
jgi:hypothetical protein